MPIGAYNLIPAIAHHLISRQPSAVLDLGIGFGNHGVAVRQWLDLGVKPWRTKLVGVEGWADYRNAVWELYDVIYARRIEEFLVESTSRFDCVLLCDVIEHFDKDAGKALLPQLKRQVNSGGCLLIGTPEKFFEQGSVYGNALEQHRSLWKPEDFEREGFATSVCGRADDFGGRSLLAVWCAA